ncbi:MAG: pyridine nucleotide-disulfide oxidoreductase, partial [Acetobacteraceae bacterium]
MSADQPHTLGFGFGFADLASRDGLVLLDRAFLRQLATEDATLHARLLAARAAPDTLAAKDESDLVVALGPHLDGFVAALFGIEAETLALARETHTLDPIHACKRLFVQRQAVKKYPDPSGFDGDTLRAELEARFGEGLTEAAFADHVTEWEQAGDGEALDLALRYAAWATLTDAGHAAHPGNTLFRVP